MHFSQKELQRYSRQISLPEFGWEGQRRLAGSRVLIVGLGGLGSPVAQYLAAAGVGALGLVDFDRVDSANLHRQLLFRTGDVGERKVDVAARVLREVNPHVEVSAFSDRLTASNAEDIARGWDLVVDGTDNFATRYLVNDVCLRLGVPNVFASVLRFGGQVSVLCAPQGPCYRCLFPAPPPPGSVPSCAEAGVLGVLPGLLGMLQATEVIKVLTGVGSPLIGRLLLVEALGMSFREMRIRKRVGCAGCDGGVPPDLIDYEAFCGVATEPPAPGDPGAGEIGRMSPQELRQWREQGGTPVVLDVREPWEFDLAHLAGATLVPLNTLPAALPNLDASRPTVIYCHHGMRSLAAAQFLSHHGFQTIWNLEGGIDAWSVDIDPSLPRY